MLGAVASLVIGLVVGGTFAYANHSDRSGPPAPGGSPAPTTGPPPAARGGAVPVPSSGAYLGAYTNSKGVGRRAALTRLEQQVGRPFDIDHAYYKWNDTFPTDDDAWTAAQGRIPLLNWSSLTTDKQPVLWADIASGKEDAVIDARAADVAKFGKPLFLAFQHEPGRLVGKGPGKAGTAEDYVAAWRHIVTRFRAKGADNATFVWILTTYSYDRGAANGKAGPDRMYPGDDVIDWIGVDGYNFYNCPAYRSRWRSFNQIFESFYRWAAPHHKPLMVAEWGAQEDPAQPGRKGEWFKQSAQELRQMPLIKAVVYFNSAPACPNWIDSTPAALAGFRSIAKDPYLNTRHRAG